MHLLSPHFPTSGLSDVCSKTMEIFLGGWDGEEEEKELPFVKELHGKIGK